MQLTVEEENELARLGLDDNLRSALRELLRGLRVQEDCGVGAEYRWGVNQVLDACDVARRACGVVERILRDRATSSPVMRCWPAQRIPEFGPLRSRVGSFMGQYRHLVTSVFDRELGRALQDLVGCPAEGAVHGPWLPRGRGRGTRDAVRALPRGSRSRSRTPPGGGESSTLSLDMGDAVPASASPSGMVSRPPADGTSDSVLDAGRAVVVGTSSSGASTCTSGGNTGGDTGDSVTTLAAGPGTSAASDQPGVSSGVLDGGAVAGDGPVLPAGGASVPAADVLPLPVPALRPGEDASTPAGVLGSSTSLSPTTLESSALPTGVASSSTRLPSGVVLLSSSSASSEEQ